MEVVSESEARRGRYKVWLIYPAALIVLAGYWIYGVSVYADLPETIPTHWGPSGAPDDWSNKSFRSVFGLLIVGAGITVMMAFTSVLVAAMSPPKKEPTRWELYRREGMIRGTIAALGLTSLGMVWLFGALSASSWNNPEYMSPWPTLLFVAFILAAMALSYWLAVRWSKVKAAEEGATPTTEETAEDKLWIGGVLYNNANDPRVLVEKREGTGYGMTVNVGSAKGRVAVVVFLVLVVGLPLVLVTVLSLQR